MKFFLLLLVFLATTISHSVANETRGKALSLYVVVQMAGIVAAQGLVGLGDPSGYVLFIIPSVLVSLSFAPILLSVSPTPAFEITCVIVKAAEKAL